MDLMAGSRVLWMDEWTRFSKSGVYGNPTLASPDKGKFVFEAVVEALVRLVREFKSLVASTTTGTNPRGDRQLTQGRTQVPSKS